MFQAVDPDAAERFGGTARAFQVLGSAATGQATLTCLADSTIYRRSLSTEEKRKRLESQLHKALEPLTPERIHVERGYIKAVCRGGEFGLYTPLVPLDVDPDATDKVSATAVALERPAVILARKIHGRMLSNGVLTLRDLYDIAAASVLAREDLEVALLSVDERDLETLSKELRLLPDDWVANPKMSGRILLEVQRPAALAQTPGRCVEVVRDLFSGDWTWADEIRAQLREEAQAKGTHGGNWGEH